MLTQITAFVVSEADNVATILSQGLQSGDRVTVTAGGKGREITLNQAISYGHKVAIQPIPAGEKVIKYGCAIGLASVNVNVGDHVHVHNVESTRGRGDLAKGR